MVVGKIAVSGGDGFIGSKLCEALGQAGFSVVPIVRKKTQGSEAIFYDYQNNSLDREMLAECSAVIHLAGKNIMSGLWTKHVKQELYDSRVLSSKLIAHSLAEMDHGPKILLNASAIGIYGDQKDLKLDEESPAGHDFLARLCVDWERATLVAKKAHIRVVNMRFGTVLDPKGGVLDKMQPLFKLGLGGAMGSGEQYFSYVTRDELVAQILFILKNDRIFGPVNMVAKEPTTNKDFSEALAAALHRQVFLRIPAFLLKALGEQGSMLLASERVYPRVLLDRGFNFADPHIDHVLEKMY